MTIFKGEEPSLAIFEEQDVQGELEPVEKELEDLRNRHTEAMSFFTDIQDKEDDSAIIEKFEPANVLLAPFKQKMFFFVSCSRLLLVTYS